MSKRIIAISRQFGSGGRTIGKELAAKLGIPCYDAEILEQMAQASALWSSTASAPTLPKSV